MATGEIRAPEGKPVLALSQIEGSIRETDPAEMARLSQALEESIASIAAVDHLLTEKLAANNTSQIANLGTLLGLILARLREAQSTAAAPVALAAAAAGAPTGVASSLRAPATGFGTITTQSDVVKALDAICAWYEANEKSSPVPYFLKRAKRLVGQDFMSIVKDVARNAEDQVKELFGTRDEGG
jgi:type VI secretion system protein ImpA